MLLQNNKPNIQTLRAPINSIKIGLDVLLTYRERAIMLEELEAKLEVEQDQDKWLDIKRKIWALRDGVA